MYDIIVIGAGPAGLTAGLYAARAEKSVLIIEKEKFGGQITFSPKVENYPGIMQISGNEYAEKLLDQVMALDIDLEIETVTGLLIEDDVKKVVCEDNTYLARSVIIATGSKHRQLGLPKENDFIGNGVSYCAICDGAFYKNQTVAIIGGGNTALQEAVLLSDVCKKVYMIQNLDTFTGEQKQVDILSNKENVEFIMGTTVEELKGDKFLSSIVVKTIGTGEKTELFVDGIFVAIGQKPENEAFSNIISLDKFGYIIADEECTTNINGVFVAGDCRTKRVKQITTAVSDGSIASLQACNYIDENYNNK